MELDLVTTDGLRRVWRRVAPFIDRALERAYGEYSADTIIEGLVEDEYQLWTLSDGDHIRGIYVTALVQYPDVLAAFIISAAAEELSLLTEHVVHIEQWAYEQGAEYIEFYGPRAWARVLASQGYFEAYTITRKELARTVR